jgi:hypothetical protein
MRRMPNGMGFAYGIRRPAFVMGVGQRDKGLAEGFHVIGCCLACWKRSPLVLILIYSL